VFVCIISFSYFQAELDMRSERVSAKIGDGWLQKILYMLVAGDEVNIV